MLWDEKLWSRLASVAQRGKSLNKVCGGRRGEVAGGKRLVGREGRPQVGGEELAWLGRHGQKEEGNFFHSNRKETYSWPFVFAGFASTDSTNHENSILDVWLGIQMQRATCMHRLTSFSVRDLSLLRGPGANLPWILRDGCNFYN